MQNIQDFESGVTVSEEPYMEEEREASRPIIYRVYEPEAVLPLIVRVVLYNAPLKLLSVVGDR